MFITKADTRNFEFIAAGETAEESRAAWEEGFYFHLKQYRTEWRPEENEGCTPLEWYEPWTFELKPGECYRDGSLIHNSLIDPGQRVRKEKV